VADSGTVNGIGRFQGGPEVPWAVINVNKGRRYRFRIINQSARSVFTFSIDSHTMSQHILSMYSDLPLIKDSSCYRGRRHQYST